MLPGHRHSKLLIDGPCKNRADDLLKLSRHQLKMVVAILTGHAAVRGHLDIMGLFEGDPACRLCRKETNSAAYHLLLRGVGLSALLCLWESVCRTNSLSNGPLPLYKRQRSTECVQNGVFKVVQ
jgi:hypothetical protein